MLLSAVVLRFKSNYPRVYVYFDANLKRILQVEIDGGLELESPEAMLEDINKIPIFRAAIREALNLVAADEADKVHTWLRGFPLASTAPPDRSPVHDFTNVSVAVSQVTTCFGPPANLRGADWVVMIVPHEGIFIVNPVVNWIGWPPKSSLFKGRGYKDLVPRSMWKRFEVWTYY